MFPVLIDKMRPDMNLDRLRLFTILMICAILSIDLILLVFGFKDRYINLSTLGILVLLFMTVFFDQFSEIVISLKDGITLKQAIRNAQNITSLLDELEANGTSETLSLLLEEATKARDAWSRIILYRIILRRLLYRCAKSLNVVLGDAPSTNKKAPSIIEMADKLRDRGAITDNLHKIIKDLSINTYFAEWGFGDRPSAAELNLVLDTAPSELTEIRRAVQRAIGLDIQPGEL